MMTKEELQNKITSADTNAIGYIVDEIMATPIPWFFINRFPQEADQKFAKFRLYMANKFNVAATEVFICGSALLGYSLSPQKNFADFNDKSDIDIVLINKKLFDRFWDNYFDDYAYSRLHGCIYTKTAKAVFKRFVDFHSTYSQKTKTYMEWERKTTGYQKDLQVYFDFPNSVSYRIYRSYSDYRQNLIKNIYDIKNPYNAEA